MLGEQQYSSAIMPLPHCPACQGLRVPAQVCSGRLLPEQPALFHVLAGAPRLQALVCLDCGQVALYTKPLARLQTTTPAPECYFGD